MVVPQGLVPEPLRTPQSTQVPPENGVGQYYSFRSSVFDTLQNKILEKKTMNTKFLEQQTEGRKNTHIQVFV